MTANEQTEEAKTNLRAAIEAIEQDNTFEADIRAAKVLAIGAVDCLTGALDAIKANANGYD